MFTRIPGFREYQIDETGAVMSNTGDVAYGYISDEGGDSVVIGIHRLLEFAYIPVPFEFNQPIPNHKDGNKENNTLSNLEWTTYSGNITHAYQTGLRTDNRHVWAMHATTREVVSFYSLGECGRFFGVEAGAIHWQLNDRKGVRPYKNYFLKYADDPAPWPEDGLSFKKACVDGTHVVLTHIETGVVVHHTSMEAVGRILGCSASSVLHQIRKSVPTPYRGYLIRYG